MKTIKTCTIPDEYKHVTFKDLENYLTFEDLYEHRYTQDEKDLIVANLGIDEVTKVDKDVKPYSNNPVAGGTLYKELDKKADWKTVESIIRDLQCMKDKIPCRLPNPRGLIFKMSTGAEYYDGTQDVQIEIPTQEGLIAEVTQMISDAVDQKVTGLGLVRGLKLEGEQSIHINYPNSSGIITVDIPEMVRNNVEDVVYDMVADDHLDITSRNPIQNRAVTTKLNDLETHVNQDSAILNTVTGRLNDIDSEIEDFATKEYVDDVLEDLEQTIDDNVSDLRDEINDAKLELQKINVTEIERLVATNLYKETTAGGGDNYYIYVRVPGIWTAQELVNNVHPSYGAYLDYVVPTPTPANLIISANTLIPYTGIFIASNGTTFYVAINKHGFKYVVDATLTLWFDFDSVTRIKECNVTGNTTIVKLMADLEVDQSAPDPTPIDPSDIPDIPDSPEPGPNT